MIYLEGGGLCVTPFDCIARAKGKEGSSLHWNDEFSDVCWRQWDRGLGSLVYLHVDTGRPPTYSLDLKMAIPLGTLVKCTLKCVEQPACDAFVLIGEDTLDGFLTAVVTHGLE